MTDHFAEVIVDVHNRKVDRSFHYGVPEDMALQVGDRVIVPFNSRVVEGIVIGLPSTAPVSNVKPILKVVDGPAYLSSELIELARWMADYYICPFIQALQTILPAPLNAKREVVIDILAPPNDPGVQALALLDPEMGQLFQALCRARKPVKLANLLKRLGKDIMPRLEDLTLRGIVAMRTTYKSRAFAGADISHDDPEPPRRQVDLTLAQSRAVREITAAVQEQSNHTILLHGVTGSGKTEVYLHSVAEVVSAGKTALVLVPEISLVPQIYGSFAAAFPGKVAVMHSALPDAERTRELQRILNGQARVVVGARSAILAPVSNLGLIIVDEEHEQTYKQEENPKYHVREVAQKRAEFCGCTVVLGSATPSLESYALALTGKYRLVSMPARIADRPLPSVEIVDLREELVAGNLSGFSRVLTAKMQDRLVRGEQVILFLNRRGFATFVVCRECGYVAKCPHCDISLTYHHKSGELRCHYCNFSMPAPQTCPACNGRQIKYFGLGTQKVEQEISRLFPHNRVLRMDADSTGRPNSHQEILDEFEQGKAQILVGTQMVAKGLDFPKVTLVGVVAADTSLNMPDFRAKERTFQLLTQVAGRAGRGVSPGEVIIQTFSPHDPSVVWAKSHAYEKFFYQEIKFRQALGYPPFNHLLRVVVSAEEENAVIHCANDLGGILRQILREGRKSGRPGMEILGPAPSPLSKLKNRYRWQVMIKGKRVEELKATMAQGLKRLYEDSLTGGISISLDMDPMGTV